MEPRFPEDVWAPACWAPREVVNYFLVLLCLCGKVLPRLLNCQTSNPCDFSYFLPHSTKGKWVRGCVGLSCLLGLNSDNDLWESEVSKWVKKRLGHKYSVWNTYTIQIFFSLCLYFLHQSENTLTVKGKNLI